MDDIPEHKAEGCGLTRAILQCWALKPRKTSVLPVADKFQGHKSSKRQQGSSGEKDMEAVMANSVLPDPPRKLAKKPPRKPSTDSKIQGQRSRDPRNSSMSFLNSSFISTSQVVNSEYTQKLRREPTFTSSELSVTIHKKPNASKSGHLYRASTGSVMLVGDLGNLKQQKHNKSLSDSTNSKTVQKGKFSGKTVAATSAMGNILKKPTERNYPSGLMNKLDPEELKSLGNVKYKEGKFVEALDLYNQAIAIDPSQASFYSNKSAALMSLGHLIEAVFECRVAIHLDPSYHNAHYRLARLYIRLGEADKAIYHFEQSGRKASSEDISRAETLETHLDRCSGARRRKDWETLLYESRAAIAVGADSAPEIYAMQAEALMEFHKHEEANRVIQEGPEFDIELYTRFLGSAETAKLLVIRSKVYMAAGRFEDAVSDASYAAQLDSSDDVNSLVKRVDFVASARKRGNRLFSASMFSEASLAYTAALEEVPYNSILLCNRAACRSKLGRFEKAVEDCTAALKVRPSYSKARLRRADSNAKLERWEAALEDYETLMHEVPGDEEVTKGFIEATKQVKKQHNEERKQKRTTSDFKSVSNNEPIRQIVTAAVSVSSEFYGSSTSFKFSSENGTSPRENFATSSEFYGSSSSFKFTNEIVTNPEANCATTASEYGRSVTTLREIFTH